MTLDQSTGVATKILKDLQKFFACVNAVQQVAWSNEDKVELKTIVSSNCYSARTALVFKSNAALRPLGFAFCQQLEQF